MKKKQILFISRGQALASTRYRAFQYFDALKKSGFEPVHETIENGLLSHLRILKLAKHADLVVSIRKTFPYPFSKLLHYFSKNLLFDFDDAIFVRSDGSYSRTRYNRFVGTVKKCTSVWAGNSYLAGIAKKHNKMVTIVPTSVRVEKYFLPIKKSSNHIDIVWIGSQHTRKYLEMFLPTASKLSRAFPKLRLKIIADFDLQYEGVCIKCEPWSEKSEGEKLVSAHIGIAPLPDNAWTRGKCGLKILQYMAAGLPVIASPAGVQKQIVEHGVTGYIPQNGQEWEYFLKILLTTKNLRKAMGKKGREKVCENYSTSRVFSGILRNLENLFPEKASKRP